METLLGSIQLFEGSFAPVGCAFCNGQVLQISQHEALFVILGNQYGGDGKTTFALPKLQPPKVAVGHVRYIIALQGGFPQHP